MRQVAKSPLLSEAIKEFIIDRRLRNLSPQTIEWYEKRLGIVKRELKDPEFCAVTVSVIRSMVGRMLDRKQAAGTINGNLQALEALLNWAFEEELEVGVDPRRIKLIKQSKKIPQILSIEQIDRLVRSIKTNTVWGHRDRMIVLTFLDTGCRLSELCSIDVEHMDLPLLKVYAQPDTGLIAVFDHLEVRWTAQEDRTTALEGHNPTAFDAEVKLFAELSAAAGTTLGQAAALPWPRFAVPAGETRTLTK
ncbi:MAG: site-specific integrase [Armatimonadota bacterium]